MTNGENNYLLRNEPEMRKDTVELILKSNIEATRYTQTLIVSNFKLHARKHRAYNCRVDEN